MKHTVLALIAVAGVAAPAWAEDVRPATFESLDTDHDGKVSGAEAQVYNALSETFKDADQNKDGFLNKSEYARWTKTGPKPDTQ